MYVCRRVRVSACTSVGVYVSRNACLVGKVSYSVNYINDILLFDFIAYKITALSTRGKHIFRADIALL